MINSPEDILKQYWGFSTFKPLQKDIITTVLAGKDTIALLPTGGGKSLCYQIPAIMQDGITIVISPLIALIREQVAILKEKGIKALALTSGISYSDLDTLLDNCIYGNYKLLYLSPERLQQPLVRERMQQMPINLVAIDEAHCISQWGHDFRPAYLEIAAIRTFIKDVPFIALTATATSQVLDDIKEQLQLQQSQLFQTSFRRPNLTYSVIQTADKKQQLLEALSGTSKSSIVYVRNRKATKQLSDLINHRGITATTYHGGLTNSERQKNYEQWRTNQAQTMVCTNAFGMGIDKADVDLVIHMEIPDSLENYFQEAGRSGRSGQEAKALLIYNENDSIKLKNQFINVLPDVTITKRVYKYLNTYFQIAYGEGAQTTHDFNFSAFCARYELKMVQTFNVLQLLERQSILSISKEYIKKATILFKVSDVNLTYYLIKNPQCDTLVKSILRTYGGIFEQVTSLNYNQLATKTSLPITTIHEQLLQLQKDDIVDYTHQSFDATLTFLVPREDDHTINSIKQHIELYSENKKRQIKDVENYLSNTTVCRSIQLLAYFGETSEEDCNACDTCLSQKKHNHSSDSTIHDLIINLLEEGERDAQYLQTLPFSKKEIITAIKLLLDQKRIIVTPTNTYKKA